MNTCKRKAIPQSVRLLVLQKYGSRCAYCGCLLEYKDMQVDHLHPVKKGGTDTPDNLMPACRSCNHYKESFTLEQFRERMFKTLEAFEMSPLARLTSRYGTIHICNQWNRKFYFETIFDNYEQERETTHP